MSIPGGTPGGEKRRSAWRKALIYLGLAEDNPGNPYFPEEARDARPAIAGARAGSVAADESALARVERKIDAQREEIAALRAEVERIRWRERWRSFNAERRRRARARIVSATAGSSSRICSSVNRSTR